MTGKARVGDKKKSLPEDAEVDRAADGPEGHADSIYCRKVTAVRELGADGIGASPTAMVGVFGAGGQEIVDAAPAAIREDWQALVDGAYELTEILKDSDLLNAPNLKNPTPEDAELIRKVQAVAAGLQGARERIVGHVKSECGVVLGGL